MSILEATKPLYNTVIIYIFSMFLIIYYKPNIMYSHKHKKFKQFGVDHNRTIFTLPIVSILIAIILYLFFSYLEKLHILQKKYDSIVQQINKIN